jgi:hypothetical protein
MSTNVPQRIERERGLLAHGLESEDRYSLGRVFLHGANDHRAEAKDGMGRPFDHFYCDRIEMLGVDVELDINR